MNISEPSKIKENEKRNKSVREVELEDVRFLLAHKQGRRFLWRYLAECNVYGNLVGIDDSHTNRLLGQRNVGIKLITDIMESDASVYGQMQKEFGSE
jgi:hypothetical protein